MKLAKPNKHLITKIDNFAISLLDAAQTDTVLANPDGTEMRVPVSLAERVKVFDSVVKYTQLIHERDDDDPEAGGIGDLARQLRESQAPRGRVRGKPAASSEDDADSADSDDLDAGTRNGAPTGHA